MFVHQSTLRDPPISPVPRKQLIHLNNKFDERYIERHNLLLYVSQVTSTYLSHVITFLE